MSTRDQRKTVKDFGDLKDTLAILRIAKKKIEDEEKREIAEARAGLERLGKKEIKAAVAPSAPASAPLSAAVDVETMLSMVLRHLDEKDYQAASTLLVRAIEAPGFPPSCRGPTARLLNAIARMQAKVRLGNINLADEESEISVASDDLSSAVLSRSSESRVKALRSGFGQQIELPESVDKPVAVSGSVLATIVAGVAAEVTKLLRGKKHGDVASHITGGEFVLHTILVGVPTVELEFQPTAKGKKSKRAPISPLAKAEAMARKLGFGPILPIPLYRADSDGIWFATMPVALTHVAPVEAVGRVAFLVESGSPELVRAARISRSAALRAEREEFEREHQQLLRNIADLTSKLSALVEARKNKANEFLAKHGVRPSTTEAKLRAIAARQKKDAKAQHVNPLTRAKIERAYTAALDRALASRNEWQAMGAHIKNVRASLARTDSTYRHMKEKKRLGVEDNEA